MAPASGHATEGMLSVEDHLRNVLERLGPLQPYDQSLLEAFDLPVCEDIESPIDLPQFTNSAMDGYAVRHADVEGATDDRPAVLPVVGESAAGSATSYALSPGSAIKIMTGAPVPSGADTVIPVEATDGGDGQVAVYEDRRRGAHIRPAAEDVRVGDLVLEEGAILGAREIGLLASLGRSHIRARPRPRVVVMSTGSELREPGQEVGADTIYDGNSYMLAAAARAAGAISYRVGIVPDSPDDFAAALSDQLVRADLVVTSGGVSMGDYDVVKETLSRLGTVDFVQIAMQPGKPQGFGFVGDERTPILTLPGNPVSAYVSFEVFGVPALRRMMGRLPYRRPLVQAMLAEDIASPDGKRQYVRAHFEVNHRGAKVTPVGGSGSHLIGGLAGANALIVVDEDETALNMGDTANVLVLDQNF
ncbi:molybdotransferase-like divisome protein Glp [Solicola gregarius]|uniref:Molybdopterin molybdenumtransferase n=1 Tax=Solicola gregarius TaxID=2908642 RepID=A0AA46TK87_9ACTN|nr:gephyrin-like molybdotransferase Glp [Solicola gregarius]UYM06635.1 molybdopterin molybdotransferase MoeA [Solicola gregarius]